MIKKRHVTLLMFFFFCCLTMIAAAYRLGNDIIALTISGAALMSAWEANIRNTELEKDTSTLARAYLVHEANLEESKGWIKDLENEVEELKNEVD